MKIPASVVFGLLCSFSIPLRAQDAPGHSEADRLQKLENAVRQLQERNEALESEVHQLRAREPFAPAFGAQASTVTPGNDNKAVFAAPKPPPVDVHPGGAEYKLTLGGYIQANFEDGDVSAFEGRFGSSALKDRFRLRRTRITLSGDFASQFDFTVQGDFGQSDQAITALQSVNVATGATTTVTNGTRTLFSATDVFINWHGIPEANVKVGQFKTPFGLEWLLPDTSVFTVERSLPTGAFTPERQIGAMVWGKPLASLSPDLKDRVTYYAGVFNGNARNTFNNDNNEFMYAGRLELLPFSGQLMGQEASLKLGGDYFFSRDQTGTTISPYSNLRVNADGSLLPYAITSPDERNAWSVDAWLKLGRFDFIGEFFNERVQPRSAPDVAPAFSEFEANGWYALGSYFIVPKKLQGVVKWEHLNPGQRGNDGIESITGGLNYFVGGGIELMANYVHTWSDFRDANPQFGQSQFDEVLLRLQLVF